MRGKPGNKLNTTVTNTQTIYFFFICKLTATLAYYSTFIVAMGSARGGQGALAPKFLEKINEFLKCTIDF